MLDVIFIICLLADPKDCKQLRAATEYEDTEFLKCLITAEQNLAKYVTKDYFVSSFGCIRKSKDT